MDCNMWTSLQCHQKRCQTQPTRISHFIAHRWPFYPCCTQFWPFCPCVNLLCSWPYLHSSALELTTLPPHHAVTPPLRAIGLHCRSASPPCSALAPPPPSSMEKSCTSSLKHLQMSPKELSATMGQMSLGGRRRATPPVCSECQSNGSDKSVTCSSSWTPLWKCG
jgi:hypothetical protein